MAYFLLHHGQWDIAFIIVIAFCNTLIVWIVSTLQAYQYKVGWVVDIVFNEKRNLPPVSPFAIFLMSSVRHCALGLPSLCCPVLGRHSSTLIPKIHRSFVQCSPLTVPNFELCRSLCFLEVVKNRGKLKVNDFSQTCCSSSPGIDVAKKRKQSNATWHLTTASHRSRLCCYCAKRARKCPINAIKRLQKDILMTVQYDNLKSAKYLAARGGGKLERGWRLLPIR